MPPMRPDPRRGRSPDRATSPGRRPGFVALSAAPEARDRRPSVVAVVVKGGRGGGTRTRDLVLPKHVRYQATLLPADFVLRNHMCFLNPAVTVGLQRFNHHMLAPFGPTSRETRLAITLRGRRP